MKRGPWVAQRGQAAGTEGCSGTRREPASPRELENGVTEEFKCLLEQARSVQPRARTSELYVRVHLVISYLRIKKTPHHSF